MNRHTVYVQASCNVFCRARQYQLALPDLVITGSKRLIERLAARYNRQGKLDLSRHQPTL